VGNVRNHGQPTRPGAVDLASLDVPSPPLVFAIDTGIQLQPAFQEEDQLLAPAYCGDLADILGETFSGDDAIENDFRIGKDDGDDGSDDDRLSEALSEQFDQYILQFHRAEQVSAGLDEDLESFADLFPELGFY
jgi:hypothetical protein